MNHEQWISKRAQAIKNKHLINTRQAAKEGDPIAQALLDTSLPMQRKTSGRFRANA